MQHYFLPLYFIFTLMSTSLWATPVVTFQEDTEAYTDFAMEYFEDTSDKFLTIDQIRKEKFQTISNAFTFGYNTNDFWFRVTVENKSEKAKEIFLELTEIIHKNVDLYVISSDTISQHEKNGLSVPIKERHIKVSNPTFSLQFEAAEKKELYIKLSSIYGVFGAIHLKTPQNFHDTNHFKEKLYMFYFGAIIAIGLYNLFLFFFLRDKIYLYYVSYVFVFVIWSANYKGILLPYITIETYNILQITIPIFFTLLILFSQAVLETKKFFLNLHYILNAFIGILMLSLLWMIIDMHTGFYFMNIAASPLLPFLLLVAFWALYKGHSIAMIYLLALSIYLISIAILSQLALGVVPYSVLLSNAPIIGSFFEIILLSLLLAYRINVLREETLDTQTKLLRIKSTESTRLLKMVQSKTTELSHLNETLAEELEGKKKLEKKLMLEASTDVLTGIFNRRSFFENCSKELKFAKRYNHSLSFIIMDIDYFKNVNDTYGHINGDIVLKDLVNIVKNTIRMTDVFGRIGGEEFAVLMPETKKSDAMSLAERIRVNIAESESVLESATVNVTVSIGLSLMTEEDSIIQSVLRRADLALFKAKENGRNQTLCSDEI